MHSTMQIKLVEKMLEQLKGIGIFHLLNFVFIGTVVWRHDVWLQHSTQNNDTDIGPHCAQKAPFNFASNIF